MLTRAAAAASSSAPLRVGVVGMGTAGLAAAIFLSRQGHECTVFERTRRADLDAPAGAGLGVQPIGLNVLHHLGVLPEVLARGSRIDRLHSVARDGRTVLDLRYADFRPELHGVGLHRDTLFSVLYKQALAEPNAIQFFTDTNVVNIVRAHNTSTATSDVLVTNAAESGESVERPHRSGPFDLVLCADGRNSIRKSMTHVKSFEYQYPWGCLWAILPDKKGEFTRGGERGRTLYQRLDGAQKMLGILPTGSTASRDANAPTLVSLFWSLDMATLDGVRKAGMGKWKEELIALEPRVERLIGDLGADEDPVDNHLIPAWYSDTFMPRIFDLATNTAFLGDCAHATSPQLGQGANLALVDAWVLSNAVTQENGNVKKALQLYDKERRWRLRFYQLNSRLLTPMFQSHSKIVGGLRDACMGPACRFPPTRLQMLTVMSGAQNNGWPWTTIPEEEYMGWVSN